MNTFTLEDLDRAAQVVTNVIGAVTPEQYGEPTPCTGWDVRAVINHLVEGNLRFAATINSSLAASPGAGPSAVARPVAGDHIGDAPLVAWQTSVDTLRSAFRRDGALTQVVPTPIGPQPGKVLIGMRTNEMLVHSWDVASATGQSTNLDPELAERCLAAMSAAPVPRGTGAFSPPATPPPGATAADRLAAFTGRGA